MGYSKHTMSSAMMVIWYKGHIYKLPVSVVVVTMIVVPAVAMEVVLSVPIIIMHDNNSLTNISQCGGLG